MTAPQKTLESPDGLAGQSLGAAHGSPPSLSQSISPDGREVWDWAAKMSQHIHRQAKIRELQAGIRDLQPRCGTCYLWMKSGMCPRETRNANGRRVGPSMSGYPCEKHDEESWVTKLREGRRAEIAALEANND